MSKIEDQSDQRPNMPESALQEDKTTTSSSKRLSFNMQSSTSYLGKRKASELSPNSKAKPTKRQKRVSLDVDESNSNSI